MWETVKVIFGFVKFLLILSFLFVIGLAAFLFAVIFLPWKGLMASPGFVAFSKVLLVTFVFLFSMFLLYWLAALLIKKLAQEEYDSVFGDD